jgi:ATP-binding cassette subfamily B protein
MTMPERGPRQRTIGTNGQKLDSKTAKRLLKLIISRNKIRLLLVVLSIISSSIIMVMSSVFMKSLVDQFIVPLLGQDNPDFSGLNHLIIKMITLFSIGILTTFAYNRLMIVVAQGTLKKIRDNMFELMQKLPIRYFDTHTHGEIMSHYTTDTDALEQMISHALPQFISSGVTLITVIFALITMSWQLSIIVFLFVFIQMNVTKILAQNSSKHFVNQQNMLGKVNGYVEEMINGQKVVKVFNYEERAKEKFDEINEELFDNMFKANKYANILMPILNNVGNIEYVVVAIIGAFLAIKNIVPALTIGTIASFLALTKNFNEPIKQLSQQINSIIMAMAGAKRIFELMDQEPEKDNGYVCLVNIIKDEDGNIVEKEEKTGHWAWKHKHHDGTIDYIELEGKIEFENVDFGYEPDKTILHDISLYAKPGQKIAFVGATGAGKTTITNLLNRFYEIDVGKIRYDGINIQKIKKEDLRKSLGLILQDTNLFTGTIKENIKYGKLDATDEEVIKAAKIANAHNFISRLPDGYDTKLTENGSQLSQGQRQLISIARAAISNPPVMIMDEATSSIDTRTEKIVSDGMDSLMDGRTVLVIAHRLSTVKNSKAIMVMEHGRIIERGNHKQLLDLKGEYYQLYTGAFELE